MSEENKSEPVDVKLDPDCIKVLEAAAVIQKTRPVIEDLISKGSLDLGLVLGQRAVVKNEKWDDVVELYRLKNKVQG